VRTARARFILHPAAQAVALLALAYFPLASKSQEAIELKLATDLSSILGLPASAHMPVFLEAKELKGETGETVEASGAVKLTRGALQMRADKITHTQQTGVAQALGNVRINNKGDVFSGPALRLKLDTLEGEFQQPTYRFGRTGAGGQAQSVQFLGPNKFRAVGASYSSCTAENTQDMDWVLMTDKVDLDFNANEGRAENAVIRFMNVPILGVPVLTFPVTEARKSGFLPPSFDIDNRNGFEFAQPYYWNIAPNRDATLTPTVSSRRGVGLGLEARYLYPQDSGVWAFYGLPYDPAASASRGMLNMSHQGEMSQSTGWSSPLSLTRYDLQWRQVSDDDYWKDFPRGLPSLTPRLLGSHARISRQINTRAWGLGAKQTTLYANVQTWQTLQDLSPNTSADSTVVSPYRREPQIGIRSRGVSEAGFTWGVNTEFNRFTHQDASKAQGNRLSAQIDIERPLAPSAASAWHLTPRISVNAVSYNLDRLDASSSSTTRSASRLIPTVSIDGGVVYERPLQWLNRPLVQTLEPRLQYVYTPYRAQSALPVFDSTARDFNQYSIFSENTFTGIDRVSDANWLNLGVTSRVIDPQTGAEKLRVGLVQKIQFSDQRITANDGPPVTQRFSDLLLLGSSQVIPHWSVDTTFQYNAQDNRVMRSLLGVRYSPGDWRTINVNYRFNRDSSEQIDVGWQWPLYGRTYARTLGGASTTANGQSCAGTWYTVGRLSYSLQDKRMSDALMGFEYDGGCWIGRIVAERVSIGRTDASTRLMLQLELVGLSRLGTSPLRTLKDNIPGYRLLREDKPLIPATVNDTPTSDD
jgi:LPS-assembly protein